MVTVQVKSSRRREMIDVTGLIARAVAEAGVESGVVVAFVPHTTAGITINENADPDVQRDILAHLEKLVPERGSWRHSEGNSDAHLQASIMGSSVTVIIENGRLVLGTWQSVFFCEFDGPRSRQLHVKVI
ncbi:MAG TPA: secondary thiamine-phosphate synthase enzyme YjbQ [bacterium]|nr:secondary thiamine-phosphate synthase enzyme YjbQ [bacterium]